MPQALPSFMQGAMQGYQFVEGVQRREEQDERLTRQEERADERLALARRQDERSEEKFNLATEEVERERLRSELLGMRHAIDNGQEIDPGRLNSVVTKAGINPSVVLSDRGRQSAETLAAAFEGKIDRNDPRVLESANWFYRRNIEKGIGETTKDGKKITDKVLQGIYPAEDGQSVYLDLMVTTEDGQTYGAAVTEGRRPDDEYVLQVPIQQVASDLKGNMILQRAAQSDDAFRTLLERAYIEQGGDPKKLKSESDISFEEIKVGNQIHTYALDKSNGTMKLAATAGRWNPSEGGPSYDDFQQSLNMGTRLIQSYYDGRYDSNQQRMVVPEENRDQAAKAIEVYQTLQQKYPTAPPGVIVARVTQALSQVPSAKEAEAKAREELDSGLAGYLPFNDPSQEAVQEGARRIRSQAQREALSALTQPQGESELPAAARQRLKEGKHVKFGNGQVWTLVDGQPKRVK